LRLDGAHELVALDLPAWRLIQANREVLDLVGSRLCARIEAQRWRAFLQDAAGRRRQGLALDRPGRWPLTARARPAQGPGGRPLLELRLCDPEHGNPPSTLLRDLFGLTPAEATVACALVSGLDPQAMAASLGVQRNTVQAHLKRVLAKTGTSRQSQCVALILRSTVSLPLDSRAQDTRLPPAPCPIGQ